jgi:hypothetical protein
VVVVRRDGFDGEIELLMDNLPDGVTAAGVKITAGESRGLMLITAEPEAPRGFRCASLFGRATIDGKVVQRPCQMASMRWPVTDAKSEIPSPRLLADVPVSVCNSELAPITIAPAERKVWEATVGEKLTIPLVHTRRCEFSGGTMNLRTWGCGIGNVPAFDVSLTADSSEAVLDLAALKTPPGDYLIAFYGSAVAKYRYDVRGVDEAQASLQLAQLTVQALTAEANRLAEVAKSASPDQKAACEMQAQEAAAKLKAAETAVAAAEKQLKQTTAKAQPTDIVDIVASTPITIRVKPLEKSK